MLDLLADPAALFFFVIHDVEDVDRAFEPNPVTPRADAGRLLDSLAVTKRVDTNDFPAGDRRRAHGDLIQEPRFPVAGLAKDTHVRSLVIAERVMEERGAAHRIQAPQKSLGRTGAVIPDDACAAADAMRQHVPRLGRQIKALGRRGRPQLNQLALCPGDTGQAQRCAEAAHDFRYIVFERLLGFAGYQHRNRHEVERLNAQLMHDALRVMQHAGCSCIDQLVIPLHQLRSRVGRFCHAHRFVAGQRIHVDNNREIEVALEQRMQGCRIPLAAYFIAMQHGVIGIAGLQRDQPGSLLGVGAAEKRGQALADLDVTGEGMTELRLYSLGAHISRLPGQHVVLDTPQMTFFKRLVEADHFLLPRQRPDCHGELFGDRHPMVFCCIRIVDLPVECGLQKRLEVLAAWQNTAQPRALVGVIRGEDVQRIGRLVLKPGVDRGEQWLCLACKPGHVLLRFL